MIISVLKVFEVEIWYYSFMLNFYLNLEIDFMLFQYLMFVLNWETPQIFSAESLNYE